MRPLYIDGAPGCRVVLDEPALRVVMPDKADQLFPLSRISRVVCNGVVDWSMSALLACADTGILILFLEKNGEVRARWLGRGENKQVLTQRLADLLDRVDGQQRYENWYLAMEKLAARSFARRVHIENWREVPVNLLRKQLALTFSDTAGECANILQSLLYGELLNWLDENGLSHDVVGGLDLATDFSNLLVWDFFPALLTQDSSAPPTPLSQAGDLYQQQADRTYLLFRSSLNKLHRFLLTVS
ncbi:MAG: CRISPR-associated endonuclease Cas1 [Methylococcales bacterium]|nr:CRISPR-associated endonuclease Cas1 [Methylococcales bacterium]